MSATGGHTRGLRAGPAELRIHQTRPKREQGTSEGQAGCEGYFRQSVCQNFPAHTELYLLPKGKILGHLDALERRF